MELKLLALVNLCLYYKKDNENVKTLAVDSEKHLLAGRVTYPSTHSFFPGDFPVTVCVSMSGLRWEHPWKQLWLKATVLICGETLSQDVMNSHHSVYQWACGPCSGNVKSYLCWFMWELGRKGQGYRMQKTGSVTLTDNMEIEHAKHTVAKVW